MLALIPDQHLIATLDTNPAVQMDWVATYTDDVTPSTLRTSNGTTTGIVPKILIFAPPANYGKKLPKSIRNKYNFKPQGKRKIKFTSDIFYGTVMTEKAVRDAIGVKP